MEPSVSFAGVDAAVLLSELIKGTQPRGMGVFAAAAKPTVTVEDAREVIKARTAESDGFIWFDYVFGRPIKVGIDLDSSQVRGVRLYDRYAGEGAFNEALKRARSI